MLKSIFRGFADIQTSLGGCWSSKIRKRILGNVKLGKNVFIDEDVLIEGSKEVTLGDDVIIGPRAIILNTEYGLELQKQLDSVLISNGVYIGPGAIIYPGVKIEEEAVVCPGAVVTSDIPSGKVASGNPAVISENPEKREVYSNLKRKRKISISSPFFEKGQNRIFKERLSIRGGVWKAKKSTKRIYEPISDDVEIGYDVLVEGEGDIILHENAVIGHRVVICTTEHSTEISPIGVDTAVYPTVIGENAIIESGSIILPGIRIGEGALVKAGSVVTKNVLSKTKVSGNPTKPEKSIRKTEIYDRPKPMFTRNFAKLSEEELKTFAGALQLYKSFIEKKYHVKSKENQIIFINTDVFLSNLQNIDLTKQALLAPRSTLASNYGFYNPTDYEGIRIGEDVWIGTGAIILSGVTLGDGAIVGAGSVVKEDVPKHTIVIGNPAKPLRPRKIKEVINLGELFAKFEKHTTFNDRLLNSIRVSLLNLFFS
jgi:acetyltransferase-like isoleucine patch superfamily enzyme